MPVVEIAVSVVLGSGRVVLVTNCWSVPVFSSLEVKSSFGLDVLTFSWTSDLYFQRVQCKNTVQLRAHTQESACLDLNPGSATYKLAVGKLFKLSIPQLPNWKMRIIIESYLIGFLRGLNELIYAKRLRQCLALKSMTVLFFCSVYWLCFYFTWFIVTIV